MNKLAVGIIVGCLLVLFGVPLFFQGESETRKSSLQKVIIVTPHNEQIRYEFGAAFDLWHTEHYGNQFRLYGRCQAVLVKYEGCCKRNINMQLK